MNKSELNGSPHNMQQNYQDAMAMVRKFGKPDLFLTFTCNPSWFEVLNCMEGVQRPEDRPDIIIRVFNMKLKELLEGICKHGIFGTVLTYIYVIEFQKRGLPHAHILLTLDSESKIRTKDDIDKFVSAELPDPCTDLRLLQIVTKCMVYGTCGTININSPCMRDGQCCKSFPKQFKDDTEENVNGYPIYRRRATEPVQIGKYSIDNRWVVPYNPWLFKKFNAHINVEVCASVKSVKYLYKYVYKGHDAASVKIQKEGALDHDEILSFVEGRYVSTPEAMWRLNGFNLSHKSHTVVRLAVHLPQQQPIVYQDGQEAQAIERAALRKTTLTSWFELNKNDPSAHNISYSDIPQYYMFDYSTTNWKKRQRGGQNVIGRLPVVSILDIERYYLRMLLLRKSGAISFDDILTVNGLRCITFQQACQEYGLLRGDQQWHDALNDAAQFQSPRQLRMLFAMICGFGEVEDVPDLSVQHQVSLCEDFVHRYSEQTGPHYALADIEELLTSYNLSLQKLHLPTVDLPASVLERVNFDVVEEQAKANSYTMQLNSEQRNVVEILLSAVYNNAADTPKCYFLDGPVGTGKTFVYSTLLHTIRGRGDDVIPVASTGILVLGCWTLERKKVAQRFSCLCNATLQYSDIDFSSVTPHELKDRAVLTVNNERSMEINNKVLEFMPGNETVYKAVDMIMGEDPQDQLTFPEEFLNSLTPTGLPPYELKLKIGCIIMLLRNLASSKGLCNGTRLIITKLQQNIIQAKSIDGTETFLIPQISLIPSQTNMPFKFKRMQFPIRLAFSMTINKS
ncbi:hypothetical protein AVEN_64890-1 [Araneus ventricosus]|uniref:ATP-dependent DNA helicase n=1 Tax=Araneus ventricosus TaxID=182803 RepID=A0A4Y2J4A1_ARAVE|nr:hypothetical protein AVEN_64890-1 [Araneus ventricosus]